ncbi:MAG: ABC-F family ATP-binding cassette domain-containing protein [Bacteroidia bacterium]
MLSVSNITVEFGGFTLFSDISFLINKGDRIGLVGKNGAGKSTMLKIIAGVQKPTQGAVAMQNNLAIGYLPQEMAHQSGKTVFDEAATAFDEIKNVQKRLEEINEELVTRTDYESDDYMNLIQELTDLNERFSMIDGFSVHAETEKILLGLGFKRTDFNRQTTEFSGGWRMRIELAKILLKKPDVILLDEPTNHLDIESIQWLEEFLAAYFGAVVLISHDKAFLDNITNRTIEIVNGKIYDYKANYSRFVELRQERIAIQLAEQRNQEKFIEHTERLIDKFRAKNSKASFAQSLIKKLERIEKVEVDDEESASIYFRFPPAPRSGKVVVEARNVAKYYGDKKIFSEVNFFIERGSKVAFVGRNGEGKSTLSKIIVGKEQGEGEIIIGHNVDIGYYAQNQSETLDGEKTVLQTLDDVAVGEIRKGLRNLLGAFLFSGDDVDKKVKVLSGGEKSRLAMCKLLLHPYNLLVLDEPTNHLDMRSKDVLKNALKEYDGTMIVVSHDRDFLQGLTDKVYEFSNGRVKEYIGDVYEYLKTRKVEDFNQLELALKEEKKKKDEVVLNSSNIEQIDKKQKDSEIKKLQNEVIKIEKEIERIEKEIASADEKLKNPQTYEQLINDSSFFYAYNELKNKLSEQMKKWEELQIMIEMQK